MSEKCQQCDICVNNCPIMEIDNSFKIYDVFFKEDAEIWKCCSCFLCEESCPFDLSPRDAMFKRRRSKLLSTFPRRIQMYHENIMSQGFAFPLEEIQLMRLEKLGLPTPDLESISKSLARILAGLDEESG